MWRENAALLIHYTREFLMDQVRLSREVGAQIIDRRPASLSSQSGFADIGINAAGIIAPV